MASPDDSRIRIEQGTVTSGATGVEVNTSHAELHSPHAEVHIYGPVMSSTLPAWPRSPRSSVPELPTHFLARAAPLAAVKAVVLAGEPRRIGIGAASRTGLHGLGGIGKTVLAAAVARDADVVAAFPDGVHWLTLGQAPDVLTLQRALLEWLTGEPVRLESVPLGTLAIQLALAGKRCLVVLDDVWQRADADAFAQVGDSSRLLVTTRDRAILTALGAIRVDLDVLDIDDALALLARWAEKPLEALPPEARDVARECGRLPLALALAGAQVRDGAEWVDLREALREGDLKFLDHTDRSVFGALDASVRALPLDQAARYRELAFVPEDAGVPESVVVGLWTFDGTKERDARALLRTFASKALLAVDGGDDEEGAKRVVRFHDLQRDYLRLTAPEPREAHGRLVDAHFAALSETDGGPIRWASLPAGQAYLWQYLIHHLLEAGRLDTVDLLMRNARWLTAKAVSAGPPSLLGDLRLVVQRTANDEVERIARALRLEAGWLHGDPRALPGLLYNRLCSSGLSEPEIARMVSGLRPAVRLRHPVRMGAGTAFRGHTRVVTSCAYSHDGARVLSASHDKTVREWDRETGRELRRFEGHSNDVTSCAYSPDDARVLSASCDCTVREWDRASGRQLRRFEGHVGRVLSCVYSPNGQRVLLASDDTLREWDIATERELQRFEGHTGLVISCAYSPDGVRVLSASHDNTVREWDRESGEELRRFEGHTRGVVSCAYSPDGARLLSASHDNTVREWDRESGEELRCFEGHTDWVRSCAYSPDGARVLSASWDTTLREWDANSGQQLRLFEGHTGAVESCAYSPDGTWVLSASADTTLREWERESGPQLRRFEWHANRVTSCRYSPDGARVLSASWDRTLREWDRESGRELRSFNGHSHEVMCCAYSPDGARILSASADTTLCEWERESGRELRRFEGHIGWVTSCAYSPDGTRVLSASEDHTVREWDRESGRELRCFEGHTSLVASCSYSPDDARVLSASYDRTVREWDRESGRELRRFEGHTGALMSCGYSADGARVLSGSEDGTVREWERESGRELRRFEGHTGAVRWCAYSPDGARVLSASEDETVKVWRWADATCLWTVYGTGPFSAVAVRNGQFCAGDATGSLWFMDYDD